jgi:head decoration protein D
MTTYTEGRHTLEFLLSEAPGVQSRDNVTIKSGSGKLYAGMVLGKITEGAAMSAAFAAASGDGRDNTGNGVMGAVTVGVGAKVGKYKLTIIEPGTNVGTFVVTDPDGIEIGTGVVAAAFSAGGLSFTLADGATDFVSGDGFNITVAAGSGKYVPTVLTAADGSSIGVAILGHYVDATSADQPAMVIARRADVVAARLSYDASVSDSGKKATKVAELALVGIRAR